MIFEKGESIPSGFLFAFCNKIIEEKEKKLYTADQNTILDMLQKT